MSDTLDIIINDARWASENPILNLKRKPAPGALHVVTVGENIPARLWFYDGPEGAASLASVRKNGVTIGLFGKLVRKDGETLLFGTTVFTELQDARGDFGYACTLDLLTNELKDAFNQGFDGSAFVDIRINGVRTHQFKLPIRPRTYAGTELDPHPAAEGLLAEMQAAAAEADADAAAANAAKVAAEAARDESVAAKDTATTKAGEAATSATAAAGSATSAGNSATAAGNSAAAAADSATAANTAKVAAETARDEAAASAASINPAAPDTIAGPTQVPTGSDPRLGIRGGWHRGASSTATGTLPAQSGDYTSRVWVDDIPSSLTSVLVGSGSGETVTLSVSKTQVRLTCNATNTDSATLASVDRANFAIVRTGLRAIAVYRDGVSVLTYTHGADTSTSLPMPTASTANAHIVREHDYFNRALTSDEIKAVARGETPAELAQEGSLGSSWSNGVGAYAPWTSFTSSGADNLSISASAGTNAACIIQLPKSKRGQYVRIEGTVGSFSGTVNLAGTDSSANGSASDIWSQISGAVSTGAKPWDLRVSGTGAFSARVFVPANGRAITVSNLNFAGAAVFSSLTVTAEGLVEHFAADKVVHSSAWCGKFGAVLRPGAGITPLNPEPSVSYVITGTVAGATVSAGTVASIGAFTPTGGLSATALASAAQWDVVSGMWAQSRPANAGPLNAQITSAGVLTFECAAHTSNAVVSANTAVKAVLTIN